MMAHAASAASSAASTTRRAGRCRAATRAQASQPSTQQQQPTKELQLVGPPPQRFSVAGGQAKDIGAAAFPALFRLGSGAFCYGYRTSLVPDDGKSYAVATLLGRQLRETSAVGGFARPAQPIVLYEFEGCPFCRKVREAVALLDLDVEFRPCPKGGPTWRPEAAARGGKAQFPYMLDPNSGAEMYESDSIIRYLFDKYGPGADQVPLGLRLGMLTTLSCGLAMLPRMSKGSRYQPSKLPQQPLVLWGYEASPFVKVVRERLSELEIPHVMRSCARGSPKRQELFDRRGHFQVPYLEDPNAGLAMWESSAILEYLDQTYAASS